VLQLAGGFANDVMTLENPANRIRFAHNPDGTVRQTWDISPDGGMTWKTSFDGKYVRSKESAANGTATAPIAAGTRSRSPTGVTLRLLADDTTSDGSSVAARWTREP
jgi:hypothetical protein